MHVDTASSGVGWGRIFSTVTDEEIKLNVLQHSSKPEIFSSTGLKRCNNSAYDFN